jgi:hypothetical protein
MTEEERAEVVRIEIQVREMIYILTRYLTARILFPPEKAALDWVRIRIDLVYRTIFHDPAPTAEYKLTFIENLFFMHDGEKYLMSGSYPLGHIQRGESCKADSDSFVLAIINYLASIQKACLTAESTGILPREKPYTT